MEKELAVLKKTIQLKNIKIRSFKLKLKYFQKINKILKVKCKIDLKNQIDKLNYVNEHAKELSKMLLVRKPITSKWSQSQRFIAQNIYFRSARTYRYLKTGLKCRLPAVSSIQTWMPVKHLKPGINYDIVNNLKMKCKELDENSKFAVLVYDEVDIKRGLDYNCYHDHIDGFTDLGNERRNTIAKSICLFLIRGLFSNYKYVLSYYSSQTNMKGDEIKNKLFENIELAENCGFQIVAVVCDQGSNNRSCYSKLGATSDKPYFIFRNKKVYALYDSPHLIKSVRNNLMASDLSTPDGIASWSILEELYEIETNSTTKMCTKLSYAHIKPNTFEEMRVCYATQIFSRSVTAGIKTALSFNKFSDPKRALATMYFCEKMDILFDALNSKNQYDSNPNRNALKINNEPYQTLKLMLNFIKEIKRCSKGKPYCFAGLVQTISGIINLTDEFLGKNEDISYIITSRFNQDPCENLFSIIRQRGGNSRNPTVHHFNDIIAQIMSMKIVQPSDHSNCEADYDEMLVHPTNFTSSTVLQYQLKTLIRCQFV